MSLSRDTAQRDSQGNPHSLIASDQISALRARALLLQHFRSEDITALIKRRFVLTCAIALAKPNRKTPTAWLMSMSPAERAYLSLHEYDTMEQIHYTRQKIIDTMTERGVPIQMLINNPDIHAQASKAAETPPSIAACFENLIKRFPDPRRIIDLALGTKDGKLPL